MTVTYTERAERVVRNAANLALRYRQTRVEPRHLLAVLCEDFSSSPYRALSASGADPVQLAAKIRSQMETGEAETQIDELDFTPLCAVLVDAQNAARKQLKTFVDVEHLLIGLLGSKYEQSLIEDVDLPKSAIIEALDKETTGALAAFAVDLTSEAAQDRLDRVVARGEEIARLIRTFQQRRPHMSMLVGESGVGKTAVVHGLAQQIVRGAVPPILQNARVISLRLDEILAEKKEGGAVEARVKAVLNEFQRSSTVLFLDDFDSLVGGRYKELIFRYANLIKTAITKPNILAVAAMTTTTYDEFVSASEWYERRLDVVRVEPLTVVETVKALEANRPRIENHYVTRMPASVVEDVVLLASRHDRSHCLPGSAFRLLDEIASQFLSKQLVEGEYEELDDAIKYFQREKEEAVAIQDFETAAGMRDQADVVKKIRDRIRELVKREAADEESLNKLSIGPGYHATTGLPSLWALRGTARDDSLSMVKGTLAQVIKGQDEAIEGVLRVVPAMVTGARPHDRPVGSLLFAGPSGTGKTLLSTQLAVHLFGNVAPRVVDLSMYSAKEDLPRLRRDIDVLLSDERPMRGITPPRGILVLDHLDSASDDVLPVISSWIRDGWGGCGYDWRKLISPYLVILMTRGGIPEPSWRYSEPLEKDAHERARSAIRDTVSRHIDTVFPVDLINRLDASIVFNSFRRRDLESIFDLLLADWRARLAEEGIDLAVDATARERIISMSQVPALGARMLQWNIERLLRQPLAERAISSPMAPHRQVRVEASEQAYDQLFRFSVHTTQTDDQP